MKKLLSISIFLGLILSASADWRMLHHGADHSGFAEGKVPQQVALQWAVEFPGERMGTAMEAIAANGRVFIATHSGNLYAINGATGNGEWKLATDAPFLQSPAVWESLVIAANVRGQIFGVDSESGDLKWSYQAENDSFSTAPVIWNNKVLIGSRVGNFYAVAAGSGELLWKAQIGVPIRQTAAAEGEMAYVTGEDLRLRAFDTRNGKVVWTTERMQGQTARDYYPMVVKRDGKNYIVVRTNPVRTMSNQIARDRSLIARNAGVDDSDWRKIDAYVKSTNALGDAELWRKEQEAIIEFQKEHPEQRTFYVFEAETGREAHVPPILWVAGCQAVGAMPATTREGELFVFYRTAYGNWTRGVAPLVGLGLYDVVRNVIKPIHHTHGMQPPWNTFWGTADESQNFTVVGDDVLITHQGTLSTLNIKTRELRTLWGERDTFGGFRTPVWARNEWHGPGRGAAAVADRKIYWLTGSRLLCIAEGGKKEVVPKAVDVKKVIAAKPSIAPTRNSLRQRFDAELDEILSKAWAPLYVEPGLHGREFLFDESGDYFRALAMAFGSASAEQKSKIRSALEKLWEEHPPFTTRGRLDLNRGDRRELFAVPEELLSSLGQDKSAHPFGGVYAAWLFADRCGEWSKVDLAYAEMLKSYEDFNRTGWKLDEKGDLFANRYLASMMALERIAARKNDSTTAEKLREQIKATSEQLIRWWKSAAQSRTLSNFNGSAELDPFIGKGDRMSFRIAPHRHKIALFKDMTPEVAAVIREGAPDAFESVWKTFSVLYATWPYQGEERQVHYGENFVDPPDLAMDAFRTAAFLGREASLPPVDIPFAKADLYYLEKLALALERN